MNKPRSHSFWSYSGHRATRDKLRTQEIIEAGSRGNIDVFGSIISEGARLLFRPLDGLLGVCIPVPRGYDIDLPHTAGPTLYRRTRALCHVELHHTVSLDTEEMIVPGVLLGSPDIEMEANSFRGRIPLATLAPRTSRPSTGVG